MFYMFCLYHFSLKCIIKNLYLSQDDPLKVNEWEERRRTEVEERETPKIYGVEKKIRGIVYTQMIEAQ